MKTKLLILIASASIVTLSFSFVSSTQAKKSSVSKATSIGASHSEPVGGFVLEDKF